ncbi:AAA family ATPase [Micromonospora rifamycinica]|uniref:AAA family ATPase n=1 Tax=Micromonospora rifamycinica TaxID=291594 RepID=UPI003437F936
MKLINREHDLAKLRGWHDESTQGRGQVAIISGPLACGKTTLNSALAEAAEEAGSVQINATASWAEQAVPFGVLDQIFRHPACASEGLKWLSQLRRDGEVTSLTGDIAPEFTAQLPAEVVDAGCDVVLAASRIRPLVLSVDDVHCADLPSLYFLSYLARRVRSARVLLTLTETTYQQPRHPLFHAELLRQPHCHQIRLDPASGSHIAAVLTEALDQPPTSDLVVQVHRISGGNLLLLQGLIADCRKTWPGEAAELVPGDGYAQSLVNCLYRCEPPLPEFARALAILGEPATPFLLGCLLGLDPDSVDAATHAMELAGILSDGWFRHPAAHAAILKTVTAEEKAAVRTHAAEILHWSGAPASQIAPNIVAAGGAPKPWAVGVLHEAADAAFTSSDVDLALSYLRVARHSSTSAPQLAGTTIAQAMAEWERSPTTAMRHVPRMLADARAGHLNGAQCTLLAQWLTWFGRAEEAEEILELGSRQPDAQRVPQTMDTISITRALLSYGYPALGAGLPAEPVPDDRAPGGTWKTLQSIVMRQSDSSAATPQGLFRLSGASRATFGLLLVTLMTLLGSFPAGEAALLSEQLLSEMGGKGHSTWQALFSGLRAVLALHQGELPAAELFGEQALALIRPADWGVAVGIPLAIVIQAATLRGSHRRAEKYLDVPVPDEMFQTPIGVTYLFACSSYHRATGNHSTALRDAQLCGQFLTEWGLDAPAFVSWRSAAASACLHLGREREARQLVNDELLRLGPQDHRIRGLCLRVTAATRNLSRRVTPLSQAVNELTQGGDRVGLAYALAELSAAYGACGDEGRSRISLRKAKKIAAECGITSFSPPSDEQPCTDEVAKMCNARSLAGLSDAELRVAVLAARGNTNRQIATRLSITTSTVEQHLTSVYRKLRVRSRNQLPSMLRQSAVC